MNLQEEIWKPILGYEGLYEISNLGRVKSLEKSHYIRNGAHVVHKEHILKPINAGNGYYRVNLSINGVSHLTSLHRLVAIHFIPNPNNLPFINHKDENPSNNAVDNLEWCTPKYNSNYGSCSKRRSEKLTGKKLTITRSSRKFQYVVSVSIVDGTVTYYDSLKEAESKGFLHSNVSKCCHNKFNKEGNNIYKGFRWYFKEQFDALTQEVREHLLDI